MLPPPEARRLVRIGTSGFSYPHWRGPFYPEGLAARDELGFYARHFDTVELNTTFYRLPKPASVRAWARGVPEGFLFAVKGSRYLTHLKRLREPREGLARFFEPLAALRSHLGPILWQLPPGMKPDLPRLVAFFEAMPAGYEHVVEFRHPGWYAEEIFEALGDLSVALCVHDLVDAVAPFPPPGPFYYRRFHGPRSPRRHGASKPLQAPYGRRRLLRQAAEMAALARDGTRCFAYFNNDVEGDAVRDAEVLQALVGEAVSTGPGIAGLELDRQHAR